MKLPEVGEKGQQLLAEATVLAVGVGGLGCASLPWLVRAGVGRIVIMDPGVVDEPDLGRQLLYRVEDIGESKAMVSARVLSRMNPLVEVLSANVALDANNIGHFASTASVILDGTDRLEPRRIINAFSVVTSIPWVYGGAVGWAGSVLASSANGPCWECVFGNEPAPPSCDEAGVIGPAVGWVGATQAAQVLRIILGEVIGGQLLTADLLRSNFRTLRVKRNRFCPVCSTDAKKSER